MAAVHGRKTKVLLAEVDITAYLRGSTPTGTAEPAEATTYGKEAKVYIAGPSDGTLELEGLFDAAVDDDFESLLRAAAGKVISWGPDGLALGRRVRTASVLGTSYALSAPVGGVVAATVAVQCDGGLDAGVSLHDLVAETATANGSGSDAGASSGNGGVGQLHVTAASGTSPTLDAKVQHSSDGSIWADLVTFASLAVPGSERKVVAAGATVNRHLRATWTISGTTPSFTFSISFARR